MAETEGQMRIRFARDFDWKPDFHTILTARGGETKMVRRAMGEAAVKEKAGVEVDADDNVIETVFSPEAEPSSSPMSDPIPMKGQETKPDGDGASSSEAVGPERNGDG